MVAHHGVNSQSHVLILVILRDYSVFKKLMVGFMILEGLKNGRVER